MKYMMILAIVFVLLIPVNAYADEQLSKFGIDVFPFKQTFDVGEKVNLGINLDPNRFESKNTNVNLQIWDNSHLKHQFAVKPNETYVFSYLPDEFFEGEVKVYVKTEGYHDETFFFVGISNPTIDDYRSDRTNGGDYYNQESNPDGYVTLKEAQKNNEASWIKDEFKKNIPRYQLDQPEIYSDYTENEIKELLGKLSTVKGDFDKCWSDVIGYRSQWIRDYVIAGGDSLFAYTEFEQRIDQDSMFRQCEVSSGIIHWNNMGVILAKNGNYSESLKYFDDALNVHPSYVLTMTNKATSLYHLGQSSEAIETLQQTKPFSQSAIVDYFKSNTIICGKGTIENNGQCVVDPNYQSSQTSSRGGGCLIATATYGSELSPQVQQLRELRDNTLLQTKSGTSFMNSFNDFYYSFSPVIADYERENPLFKEMVKIAITPMISSLSILNYMDMDSESGVLGYGISLILLNVGMYFGIPAIIIMRVKKWE